MLPLLMKLPGALLQLCLWCCLFVAGVWSAIVVWEEATSGQRGAWLFAGACALMLGLLLGLNVYRLMLWRRRRSRRPSEELRAERRRIARDLHDGVGSQLVSASALLDRQDPLQQRLAEQLDQCLLDLRLVVDSMDGVEDGLLLRMARLRHRLQPALAQRGLSMDWDMPEVDADEPQGLAAQALLMITQEAVSNVLQHADATELRVVLSLEAHGDAPAWHLRVLDNGRGGAQLARAGLISPGGYGLASMRARAAQVGASLQLEAAPLGGLCMHVVLPARSTTQP